MNSKTTPIRMHERAVTGIINAHNTSHTASMLLEGQPTAHEGMKLSRVLSLIHSPLQFIVTRSKQGLRDFFVAQYTEQSIPTEWNTTR